MAMACGYSVRLWIGDSKTGKDWLDEYDVIGKIGRSIGPIKVPLLIHSSRSMGGGAILCDCIIRLMVNGREVYRHPKYHQPKFTVSETMEQPKGRVPVDLSQYKAAVLADGEVHARFKSRASAENWIKFMHGERMRK